MKRTGIEQKQLDDINLIVEHNNLFPCPYFNKQFDVYMSTWNFQQGEFIIQEDKPISFYSRKLTRPQKMYKATEQELLSIVETLKSFQTLFLVQQLKLHTDHKNLTYKMFNTDIVLIWRLILEECSHDREYIVFKQNMAVDTISELKNNTIK